MMGAQVNLDVKDVEVTEWGFMVQLVGTRDGEPFSQALNITCEELYVAGTIEEAVKYKLGREARYD